MQHQDKKLELLRNRIQSDLNVEPENLDDLVNFVIELLKKSTKDRLLTELKEIYEGSANVDSFVEWVWGVFGQEQKSAETPKKDLETSKSKEIEKKQPNKSIGVAKLAEKALFDVNKSREKEEPHVNGNKERKPLDRSTVTRFKMNQNRIINTQAHQDNNDDEKMRSSGRDSKPIIKLKGDNHSAQPAEQRKTGSILDRVIKAGDKNKRPLPTAHEEAKVDHKYEKIEKKIKPDPVSTSAPPTKPRRTIKTAAQVRAEEEMARAQASAQAVLEPDAIEDKGPTMEMQKGHSEAPAKLKIRCRNWPNCKNEECIYHHPTENCKFFPSCPYGEKCLYIHPAIPCKFKEFCQRPGCSYVHPRQAGGNAGYYGFGQQQPMKKKPFGGNYKFAPKAGARSQNMGEEQGGPSNQVES